MEDSLSAGVLLARRYRLIDPIGAGGMSVIWRARDEVLVRMVALKVLASELAADKRFRDLVRTEARSAAQLVHRHVTAVYDYGEMLTDAGVTAFVVMELLEGELLERRLTAGPLPWPETLEICGQVAEALAAAHRLGIVHRDVTPGNIMLTRDGVKVLDFGIATRVGTPDEDDDGDNFGTPAYVAPERLDGTPALPATDTYALGVLLYETLTGRVPFPALTWEDLASVPRHGVPPAPTGVAGLPPAVAELTRRCLARDPLDRPTAHQVAQELAANLPGNNPEPAPPPQPTVLAIGAETGMARAATDPAPDGAHPSQLSEPAPVGSPAALASSAASGSPEALGSPASRPSRGFGSLPANSPGRPAAGYPPSGYPSYAAGAAPSRFTVAPPGRVVTARESARRSQSTLGHDEFASSHRATWVRAVIAAAAAAVVVATAAVVGMALSNPNHRPSEAQVRIETNSPAPSPTIVRPFDAPKASASSSPTRRSSPTTGPVPTVGETITTLYRTINDAVSNGQLRKDAAADLQNLLNNLKSSVRNGAVDLANEAAHLQSKVADRLREGAVTQDTADALDVQIQKLAIARY